jgi:hypothetical protein
MCAKECSSSYGSIGHSRAPRALCACRRPACGHERRTPTLRPSAPRFSHVNRHCQHQPLSPLGGPTWAAGTWCWQRRATWPRGGACSCAQGTCSCDHEQCHHVALNITMIKTCSAVSQAGARMHRLSTLMFMNSFTRLLFLVCPSVSESTTSGSTQLGINSYQRRLLINQPPSVP